MTTYDFIIIGAGIAGASLAYRLSADVAAEKAGGASVLLLEMEDQPGRHSTGRSAAFYAETYGNETIRRITAASRAFYEDPPKGFTDAPLLEPCGALHIGTDAQGAALDEHFEATRSLAPTIERRDGVFAKDKVPVLDETRITGCVWEPDSKAINVHELHQGFLSAAKRSGVSLVTRAEVRDITRSSEVWSITAGTQTYEGSVLINAAGAWAGDIGRAAGAMPLDLTPFRRSVCVIDPKKAQGVEGDVSGWPLVIDIDENFYFKPSGGTIWLSPADETPSPPCDAQPEELDIARAVHHMEEATSIRVRRIEHQWAGLRTFSSDRTPAVGFDPTCDGFFWLAGQGGYGIQTAPALSEIAAHLLGAGDLPKDLVAPQEVLDALNPGRF